MTREKFMISFSSIRAGVGTLKTAAILALLSTVAACTAGGPATTQNQAATSAGSTAKDYTGPAPRNADVQAFKNSLWVNIHTSDKCGACHNSTVGQAPEFARSDDVNQAYDAAVPLVNFTQPDQSTLVLRVKSGHNCWLSDPNSCGDIMLQWIQAWIGSSSSSTSSTPPLQAPPSSTVSGGKQFPTSALTEGSSPPDSFKETVYPLLAKFCSGCHTASASVPQTPYFATGGTPGVDITAKPPLDSDVEIAYQAAQAKINLNSPDQSRFYQRLNSDHHNCWVSGTPDPCTGSAAAMLAAIQAFANGLAVQQVDASLVVSKALALKQGTIASGGNRAEANIIAKYEFKTGTGTTAFDTSGVTPSADLQLTSNVTWAGGWGINIPAGGSARALTATSAKISNMITGSGEFTIEAWVIPANVTQTNAWIVTYSGSDKTRNVTLGQHAMQYSGATRSDKTDANGGTKPIMPDATKFPVQAALQHVVLTYDPVNGQKLYINGVDTGATDPAGGGSLASWDNTFALVLGAETTGKEQWLGTIKFVAIHSRALTPQQVMQNFNAGVGEKYFLLFDVSGLTGVAQSYIQITGFVLDSYAYQFVTPTFVTLNPNAAVGTIPVKGIRVGVNGVELPTGQSYSTVNTNITANGQVLSPVGAVVASDKGPDGATPDMFFLTFDQIGTHTHARTDPVPATPTPSFPTVPPSRKGVKNFAQVNNALSVITGVPVSNTAVNTLYNTLQQSLPPTNDLGAFLPSHQTAISALADQYCNIAVNSPPPNSIFSGLTLPSSPAGFAQPAAQNSLITPILAQAIGTNVNPAAETVVRNELSSLMSSLANTSAPNRTAATIAQAACTAALGSAVVSLQ